MKSRAFTQVDVFTNQAYLGNPVAVVMDSEGLTDAQMQQFARWTNLSETTFVLPASAQAQAQGADYRVRIFTPGGELPFAGHPTLGTAHAWRQAGGQPQNPQYLVQECGVGLVMLRPGPHHAWSFAAPQLQRSEASTEELDLICHALGVERSRVIRAQHLHNGPHWLGLLLDDPQTVWGLEPDHEALKQSGLKIGVAAKTPLGSQLVSRSNREARAFAQNNRSVESTSLSEAALEVRAFAAAIGIAEDPVTGSLNASLAQWLIAEGVMPTHYTASQGVMLGRNGRVHLSQDADGQVWVGGDSVSCITGHVVL